jgi:hypothetical protein
LPYQHEGAVNSINELEEPGITEDSVASTDGVSIHYQVQGKAGSCVRSWLVL